MLEALAHIKFDGEHMKTESIEDFLARGGNITKSTTESSLDELLYNEGILNHKDAEEVKRGLSEALNTSLDKEFSDN
jgi:predicted nucleotidyltransferase